MEATKQMLHKQLSSSGKMWLFFITLILLFSCSNLKAQNASETMQLGHQYYSAKDFDAAIKTYQRVNFFDQNQAFECKYWIGESYYADQDYKTAATYFDQAYYLQKDDSIRNEMSLRKTLCLIKQRKFPESLVELYALAEPASNQQAYRQNLYLAVACFGTGKYEKSQQYFTELLEDNQQDQDKVIALFAANKKVDRLNANTARWLSIFIPGAGQIYAGDFKAGINSMVLTGLLLFALLNTAAAYTFWDALISVFPWYYRYYMGGIDNAVDSVAKRKQKQRSEIYSELLKVVE